VRIVMSEIVRRVNPAALIPPGMTLPVLARTVTRGYVGGGA
jgi:hypothetical protein